MAYGEQVTTGDGVARVCAWGLRPTTISLWVPVGSGCSIFKMPPHCFLATSM